MCVKYCFKLNENAIETNEMVETEFGGDFWAGHLLNGLNISKTVGGRRQSTENDPRSGTPSTC